MSDERKKIFSEGVTVEVTKGGGYRVTDVATGAEVFGVAEIDIRAKGGGLFSSRPRTEVALTIATGAVHCTLVMDADVYGSDPTAK